MKKQFAQLQAMCPYCSKTEVACTLTISEDWRDPFLAFLVEGTLGANIKEARRLKNTAKSTLLMESLCIEKVTMASH